jgi:putative transposase
MEAEWDTAMISEAIVLHGKPEIIHRAIDPIAKASSSPARPTPRCSRKGGVAEGVHISAEGKGRAIDNVSIERFWRTLKHHHL